MGKPIYLQVEKEIKHSPERVWETVAMDFGGVSKYNPEIKSSQFDSDIKMGVGAQRHCDFPKTGYIKEEITEWDEGKSFKLKFIESSIPMAKLESKFTFSPSENGTLIRQEFWYRMKAPMGWLSGMMKGKMRSTLENGLNGLENYLNEK